MNPSNAYLMNLCFSLAQHFFHEHRLAYELVYPDCLSKRAQNKIQNGHRYAF